ncbi:retinol dehydrogenase 12 [Ixodes scapularis]|uniref:retinol dehydrogenase 12 n=1 Tax=Ixodes scapularis TaxID=6945 RepID=UPI001AD6E487|nr:retinol dehydrogenase 12 [Ixodes scapularis]
MEATQGTPTAETTESGVDLTGLWIFLGIVAAVFFLLVAFVLCLKVYNYCIKGVCTSPQQMDGKTVIITGGNAGIGKETAKELARRKARVILACRNINKGQEAANEIFLETQQAVVVKHLDLSSLKSVRDFARDIVFTEPRLDVLINNAGMTLEDDQLHLTEDGYELAFQTNYLGHFLLTMLLLDLLKKTAPSRVVNVSSGLHHVGATDHMEERMRGMLRSSPTLTYSHTKMANVMFTIELAKRLKNDGVTVNALHPGMIETGISDGLVGRDLYFKINFWIFGKTAKEGAQTSIYLAVDPKLSGETGYYFSDCRKAWINWRARNAERNRELFETSVKLTHLEDSVVNKQILNDK